MAEGAELAEAQAQTHAQRITQLEGQLWQAEQQQQQHQAHETQLAVLQAALTEQRQLIERLLAQPAAGPEPAAPRRATAKKQP